MTLGKGTTGSGAGTVGPSGGLYTSQADTGLPNNGYGTIAGGTRPTDTDNDGMPDVWESANGSNVNANDAMTKAADGYVLIEHYINWLAGPHAQTAAGASVSFDLSTYAAGFSNVSPTYAVSGAQNGTVALAADKHTAQFQPTAGFHGLGVLRLHGDRLGRQRVHEPGVRARDAPRQEPWRVLRPPARGRLSEAHPLGRRDLN